MDHYSYTQLSTYLQCPLKYKYHYLEGWQETEDKASLFFGRVFQSAVEAQFLVSDSVGFFTGRWGGVKDMPLEYGNGDSWEKMLEQGQALLEQFRQDQRVLIEDGRTDFQVKFRRPLPLSQKHFLAYVDGIGYVDGRHCLIEWKTTSQSYPENLGRVLELDPQLVCYSWAAQQQQQVCLVNFVRKKQPEIQYLRARIRKRQWKAFEQTLDLLASEVEAGHFYPRSGIRYPNNQCLNCAYLGLCLRKKVLVEEKLVKVEELGSMDKARAQQVLARIDEILRWEQRVDQQKDQKFAELGKHLCEVREQKYWRLGYQSFEAFLERKFPDSRRKAYYLMSIHDHLRKIPTEEIENLGWSKALELAKVARSEGRHFDSATWLHKAKESTKQELKEEVYKYFTGEDYEPYEMVYFKLFESQLPTVERALYVASRMVGTERSRGYCLELVCADFLAGRTEESTPEEILMVIHRLVHLLPPDYQARFAGQSGGREVETAARC